ncbi:MAG: hypothetical protein RL538_910, partial [Candidatus Parcubacteria bacterium]
MRRTILFAIFFLLALPALAYNPITAEPKIAYEVIPVEGDPYVQR